MGLIYDHLDDDNGGSYITRENEFAVDAFMKARLIPTYRKEIKAFQRQVYIPEEADQPKQFCGKKEAFQMGTTKTSRQSELEKKQKYLGL